MTPRPAGRAVSRLTVNPLRQLRKSRLLGRELRLAFLLARGGAAESGNMLALLSSICVSLGATACETAPKIPSRVAMRTGLQTIASTTRSPACEGVGTFSYILVGAIIGVRTSGMLIVVKSTPLSMNSDAAHAANESSADFDATFAENRGALDRRGHYTAPVFGADAASALV
jgi:hypothetical protein